jgi:hypothetical protein
MEKIAALSMTIQKGDIRLLEEKKYVKRFQLAGPNPSSVAPNIYSVHSILYIIIVCTEYIPWVTDDGPSRTIPKPDPYILSARNPQWKLTVRRHFNSFAGGKVV